MITLASIRNVAPSLSSLYDHTLKGDDLDWDSENECDT